MEHLEATIYALHNCATLQDLKELYQIAMEEHAEDHSAQYAIEMATYAPRVKLADKE